MSHSFIGYWVLPVRGKEENNIVVKSHDLFIE